MEVIKEKILKDKKILILSIVLFVFTITYFIVTNNISHAFVTDYSKEDAYKVTVNVIKKSAVTYGNMNLSIFQDDTIAYIKVQDLIDNNIIATNENGNIINPITEESMNGTIIKLKNENKNIIAELD